MSLDEQHRIAERLQAALGEAYRLDRELPAGGMSRLFLATDTGLSRQVVVKLLPPDLASAANATRFRREMEIAGRLQHPHILPILNAGTTDTLLYYVMPYVEGESLRHALNRERRMPVGDALRILREIADALVCAHGKGVVHRDIKPENILLEGSHAVLTDFGVARALDDTGSGERVTGTGFSLGTPGYMAPEQIAGERNVDARADVYALAVVGYEMLTGESPFTGNSPQAVLAAHMSGEVPSVRAARNDVPQNVDAALKKALAKDPADRQQSAAEFLRDIGHSPGKGPDRRPPAFAIAIGATLVLALIAIWLIARKAPVIALEADRLAVAPFDLVGEGMELWREGLVDLLSRNLDGAGPLTTVAPTTVIRRWSGRSDVESASLLAKATGARFVVYGSLIRTGLDSVRIRATIRDVGGERAIGEIESGGLLERMDLVADSFTVAVLEKLNAPQRKGGLRISSLGSSSLAAIRTFLRAEQHFRASDWDSAAAGYRVAVELDSSFALGWSRLALTTGWIRTGNDSVSRDAYLRAGRHNVGLSERDSLLVALDSLRGLVFAGSADTLQARHTARMLAIGNQLVERYPDDPMAWYADGENLFHFGVGRLFDTPAARIRASFDEAIALDSAFAPAYIHPVELALQEGDTALAQRYLAAYLAGGPTDVHGTALRLVQQLIAIAGSPDSAIAISGDSLLVGGMYFATPIIARWPDAPLDLEGAKSALTRQATRAPDPRASRSVGFLLLNRGRLAEAIPILPPRLTASPFVAALQYYLTGKSVGRRTDDRASANWILTMPRRAEAQDTAWFSRELLQHSEEQIAKLPPVDAFNARYDRGLGLAYEALARMDTTLALQRFEALPDSACLGCSPFTIAIARSYIARSRFADALKLLPERAEREARLFEPLIRFERARALEALGRIDEAVQSYAWVVGMWRNADEELQPVVAEARSALARLTAEGRR